jgi:hypothetical protein
MSLKATVENIVASAKHGSSLRAGMSFSLLVKINEMFNSSQKNLFIEILEAVLFEFRRIIEYQERVGQRETRSEQAIKFKEHMVCILNRKELYDQHGTEDEYDEMIDELSWFKTGIMFRTQEKDIFFQIISELIDTFTEQ